MLDARSLYLRGLIFHSLLCSGRGHVGPSLSLVEILRVLYDDFLNYRPNQPLWEERDRFILSKGHGCLALYAILADKGFFPLSALDSVAFSESFLGGHPEKGPIPGVEASTGSLGHGLSIGIGMAHAAQIKDASYRVVVVLGDGELNEGSVWEGLLAAAHHKLNKLIIFIDRNRQQIYGGTSAVCEIEPLKAKLEAFGWSTVDVEGHSLHALRDVCKRFPLEQGRPSAVICHTIKGKGLAVAEGNLGWHYKHFLLPHERILLSELVEQVNLSPKSDNKFY